MTKPKKAFTLLEILVVLGIMMASALVFIPISSIQQGQNEIRSVTEDILSRLSVIQQGAFSGKGNTNHGIALFSNRYELFEGSSYAEATNIEVIPLESDISLSSINFNGGNILIFNSQNIRPQNAGSFTVTNGISSYSIVVNAEGFMDYNKL